MQGGVPGLGRVRIGALVEQEPGERGMAAVRGHDEGAGARRRGVVHVGARGHEMPGRIETALSGREQDGRVAALHDVEHPGRVEPGGPRVDAPGPRGRAGMDVRPERGQRLHDVGMLLGHRPHQRRLPPRALAGVQVGAVGREQTHRLRRPGAGRGHQHRLARGQRGVRVGAGRQQGRDHRLAGVEAGQPERGDAEVVRRVDGGAGPNERVGHRRIVPVGGPVQGARAVRLPGIRSGALFEQGDHPRRVRRPGRVDQPCVLGGGAGTGHGRQPRRQDHRSRQLSRMHVLRPPRARVRRARNALIPTTAQAECVAIDRDLPRLRPASSTGACPPRAKRSHPDDGAGGMRHGSTVISPAFVLHGRVSAARNGRRRLRLPGDGAGESNTP